MATDLTKQVEEPMSVISEAGRSVGTLHTLLMAMAEQIEANEKEIKSLSKHTPESEKGESGLIPSYEPLKDDD